MGGPLPIPISEIDAYCRFHEYDFGKRVDFLFYIERMDQAFMKHLEEMRADQTQTGTPPPPK
jgi:hypothetical protein